MLFNRFLPSCILVMFLVQMMPSSVLSISYEYYSPVQPVRSIIISNIYAEDINGDLIKSNERTIKKIKEIVKGIDKNIEFIELVQERTVNSKKTELQLSLKKNNRLCLGSTCMFDMPQDILFLRDPFLPVAVFAGDKMYTEMNVLSKYKCFGGSCSPLDQYKLKTILGNGTVFNDIPGNDQNMGGNLLALPGRTFLSIDDSQKEGQGSAFMYSPKFNNYRKIILDEDELLGIGHVDEMIQIIPDPTSRCGAALVVASPSLFLDKFGGYKLSYFNDNKEDYSRSIYYSKLQDFTSHIGGLFDRERTEQRDLKYAAYYKKLFNLNDSNTNYSGIKSYLNINKEKITLKMLIAPYVDYLEEKIQKNIDRIRNNYVCPTQDHIAKIKFDGKDVFVKDSIRGSKPDASLSVYRMPVMWLKGFTMSSVENDDAYSIFPNFINSVIIPIYEYYPGTQKVRSINVHVIVPDVYVLNDVYKDSARKMISDIYSGIEQFVVKRNNIAGLKIDYRITPHFMESYFYGSGRGELHCATNEIRQFFYQ